MKSTKIEALNTKQALNSKLQTPNLSDLVFGIYDLFRVLVLGFRILLERV